MNIHSQIMSLRLQFDAELEEAKNAAYSEGRKDEREASCVDELVAALKSVLIFFPTDSEMQEVGMTEEEVSTACVAYDKARAVLTKLEQT